MTIDQKMRSLYCGLQAGLNFREIDGPDGESVTVMRLRDVPFEMEEIVAKWICAMPSDMLVGLVNLDDETFSETGWIAFVSWMLQMLHEAQCKDDFEARVQTMVIARRDFD